MQIRILKDKQTLGKTAAEHAANSLRAALREKGEARIVVATGASQFEFLDGLTRATLIDWSRIELFHLDEYIGLPVSHPASFRKYIRERIIDKTGISKHHLLNGEADPQVVTREIGGELAAKPVDLAFVGIGENGHLAFNDPPADFTAEEPYIIVTLDEPCRLQQVNEGWFAKLEDVPPQAISMSIRQILRAREIIAVVPDQRKAKAVAACLTGAVSPLVPASILREHLNTTLYFDEQSASLLPAAYRASWS